MNKTWALATQLPLIAMLSFGPAWAEWIDIGGKVKDGVTVYRVYIDPDNIHRNGEVVTLWVLFDYQTIQSIVGGPWLSSKARREFDCTSDRIRLFGYMTFTGNMGSGEAVFSNSNESQWEPIAPDSIDRKLLEVVCAKK